ncbi:MAG: response regulator [Flavobacteriaceae bacterium]|nr:response regulator [Flavobacteriaceae bacterium]
MNSSLQSPIKLACVIDDDNVYINLIKKIVDIKKLSENLLVFKNGKEALDYFIPILENISEDSFPEIILLDLNMPVMDGWNFLREFTKIKTGRSVKTTIYVVSSSINPYDVERAKSYSLVSDYLIKPVNLQKFESLFNKNSA